MKENAWPTHVLTLSTNRRSFCIKKKAIRLAPDGCSDYLRSGLLRRRLARGLAEVVVVGHATADVGVEVPAHRARGERLLRSLDLLEQRVAFALLGGGGVVAGELALQHGVGRLVEAHLVLGLQFDVVLRVAVDRLP